MPRAPRGANYYRITTELRPERSEGPITINYWLADQRGFSNADLRGTSNMERGTTSANIPPLRGS